MSTVQEVQDALRKMSPEERNRVKAFLLHLSRADDGAHRDEMSRRLQRIEQGGGATQEDLQRLHERLSGEGR